ncbi:MAG: glycogen synthase GlgA [Deltaproteobacteria bacterium]|nr:glycogen synthase GlgA [Deltaproteobacteria bacterium]
MRVLHVASEAAPWAQTGGLADVVGALPQALAATPALDVGLLIPLYRGVLARLKAAGHTVSYGPPLAVGGVEARLASIGRVGGVATAFLDAPALYDREGLYSAPSHEFIDNHRRFAALCRAAVAHGPAVFGDARPVDVIHAHDWQAALAPAYVRLGVRDPVAVAHAAPLGAKAVDVPPVVPPSPAIATVFTILNLAYQGRFAKRATEEVGLPWSVFTHDKMEAWDQLCLLKGGLVFADRLTTVSPTYAREIRTHAAGEGLDGFLRHEAAPLSGIVNGIDAVSWDPARDPALAAPFALGDMAGKARCKAALLAELGWTDDDSALAVVIARMTSQKGLDLVAELVPEAAALGVRIAVLGAGDRALEDRFTWLADTFRDHVRVAIGFDVARARRYYAGADLFVMPSRFEPCGIGQMYAMRYGAVPVVSAVGGLVDTVEDVVGGGERHGTGFRFAPVTTPALHAAMERALAAYRAPEAWARIQARAMRRDSSWRESADAYAALYADALDARRRA